MASPICLTLDPDELGGELQKDQIWFTTDEKRVDRLIREISMHWPNNTICIYRLNEVQKIKTHPTYQRYKVSNTGEVLPE